MSGDGFSFGHSMTSIPFGDDCPPAMSCDKSCELSVFRIEHRTGHDTIYKENSWEVKDITSNTTIHSIDFGIDRDHYKKNEFYNETFSLKAESCYEFTMKEQSYGDDDISYNIFYNGVSIMIGSDNVTSIPFGDDCPTATPSLLPSSWPSSAPSCSFGKYDDGSNDLGCIDCPTGGK